jgi:hypothetical protein
MIDIVSGNDRAARHSTRPSKVTEQPEPIGPRTGWALIAVVTAVAFLLPLRALLHAAGPSMEEGFMLVFPERVLHGAVPNKDFLNLYGPGSLWVLAGVYKVFGVHILVERIVGLLQLVGIAVGAALLMRWWGRWVAVVAVLLTVMFLLPTMQLTAIPWSGAVAFGLFAVTAFVQARHDASDGKRARSAAAWAVVGGVLAGIAMLYRIDLGPALVLAGSAALWGLPRRIIRRALAGVACGLAPYLVHIALAGLGTVWRGMLVDPMLHLRAARGLPVPPPLNKLQGVARVIIGIERSWPLPRLSASQQLFVWFAALAFLTPVLVALALFAVRRNPEHFRPRVLLAGTLFAVGLFPQAVQRADGVHFAWVSGVLVILIPAAISETARAVRMKWRPPRVALVSSFSVIVVCALLLPTYTARRYVALVQDSMHPAKTIAIVNEGRTFYIGEDPGVVHSLQELLKAVERDAKPGSRLIVGNTDMRRVPYVDSFLYYLLPQYKVGTSFIEFEPGLTNRRGTPLTSEMHHADVFIASDRWLGWDEPNASMKPGDPGPQRVLRQDFCEKNDFGNGYKLFLRCVPKAA